MKIHGNQKGQAIVLIAVGIVVFLAVVGLAIDAGIGYGVKAKLSGAVDAAAIAAGNAVGTGSSQSVRTANARAAARNFFAANFPPTYLGAARPVLTDGDIVVAFGTPSAGMVQINVTTSATVPTYFIKVLRLLGFNQWNQLTAGATAQVVKRTLDMAFVMDNTGSLHDEYSAVKTASYNFINKFGEDDDRVAFVRFATGAIVPTGCTIRTGANRGFAKTTMLSAINNLTSSSFSGLTNFGEGLYQGYAQLNTIAPADYSTLRVIVFFSDGAPNTFASRFQYVGGGAPSSPVSGSVASGDGTGSGDHPSGLYRRDRVNEEITNPYFQDTDLSSGDPRVEAMPTVYYNPSGGLWPFASSYNPFISRRALTSLSPPNMTYTNVNRASRNLAENMANAARAEGIFVFTLGLGDLLTSDSGPAPREHGDVVLKRMANDPTSDTFNPAQPVGMYAYAANSAQLDAAFTKIRNAILRLTK